MKQSKNFVFKFKRSKKSTSLLSVNIILALAVFAVLVVALGLAASVAYILVGVGIMESGENGWSASYIILFMVISSIVLGSAASFVVSKFLLRPVKRIIKSMDRLSEGDFTTRMAVEESTIDTFRQLSQKFNSLAEELESTEMLRSDFINNFSHEFKTPIVSITGLAKVLKKGKLSEEQRREYLDAIEEESMRLSYLATSVLNLTKVENQSILTDITCFNLSEQIRSCILLLDTKWEKKQLNFALDFDEYYIEANEELLKQVFINLVDNAIKFSENGGSVDISIENEDDSILVSVSNYGKEISPEQKQKIFNKFYQADESHSSEGYGVGLAIVKKIVTLHNGNISVESENGRTTFTVILPQNITTE